MLIKLTDENGRTRGGTQWGPGVSHSGTGEGNLCGPGYIHVYETLEIAQFMSPIHVAFKNPIAWESEGIICKRDGQLKAGCRTLTTIRQVPLLAISTDKRVKFAILCGKSVYSDAAWNRWADGWLSGDDRSARAAQATATAAELAATWAAAAARAAELAAEAAVADFDLAAIARRAMEM
jgi:hypothetical protein